MESIIVLFLFAALALFLLGCKEGIVLLRKKVEYAKPQDTLLIYPRSLLKR